MTASIAACYPVRPAEFEILERLNQLHKLPGARKPLDTIRFVYSRGRWWAECPTTGFGYPHKTLNEAVQSWDVTVIACAQQQWIARPN